MKSVTLSITRVNRLRRAAERARALPAEDPDWSLVSLSDDWFASAYDANELIGVFDTLRLKARFTLHAYEYRAGDNGNGIIWAVPADAPLVAPGECPRLEDRFLHPPRPPGAVPLMQAIEGRRESLVVPVRIDPAPRGSGIRGKVARLRLERPDDSLQAPAAGRRSGCVVQGAEADRRCTHQQLDVARRCSSHVEACLCR